MCRLHIVILVNSLSFIIYISQKYQWANMHTSPVLLWCVAAVIRLPWQQLCRHSPGWSKEPGAEEADVLGTPAGFTASLSLLASISPPLPRHLSPESVTAISFICIYFPPFPPPCIPSHPFGFTSPAFRTRFLASPLCPIAGVTVELSKHSLRCWSTLHAVMCHLCITQDVVRMTLLGWHVLPEDIMFTLSVFTWSRHVHWVWDPISYTIPTVQERLQLFYSLHLHKYTFSYVKKYWISSQQCRNIDF